MDKQPLWHSRGLLLALVALAALAGATALFGQHGLERRDAGAVNAASAPITDPAIVDPVGLAPADLAELSSLVDAEALLAPLRAGASTTPIIVSLAPSPNAESLGWRAGDHNTATPAGWDADLSDPLIRAQRQQEVASEHDWLLDQLATPGLEITEVFRYQFGIAGNATVEALEHLAQHPAVRQIEPDRRLDGTEPNAASPSATRPETATTVSALIADWEQAIAQLIADSDASARVLGIETASQPFATPGHCDAQLPALATAAAHARAAGISLFAPAGDDGYCDRLAWPACLSGVHAIGAVYSEDLGWVERCVAADSCVLTEDHQNCPAGTLVRDRAMHGEVPAYSNSHPLLSLLATAPTDQPPRTQAASARVVQAAETLQNTAQRGYGVWLTALELERLLTQSGEPLTDPKSGVATPQLQLQRAMTTLPALLEERDRTGTGTEHGTGREHVHQGTGRGRAANASGGEDTASPLSALRKTTPTTRAAGQCPYPDHLALDGQTVSSMQTFSACQTLAAGPSFTVAASGDVVLEAEQQIRLQPGFQVQRGGRLSTHLRPAPIAQTVQIDVPSEQLDNLTLTSLEESDLPASTDTLVVPQTTTSIAILSDSDDNIAGIGFSSPDQNQRATTSVSIDATSTAVGLVLLSPLGWIDTGQLTTEERIAHIQNSTAFPRLVELVRAQQQTDAASLADNLEILEAVWDVVADVQPTLTSAQAERSTPTAPWMEGGGTVRNPNFVPYGLSTLTSSGQRPERPFSLGGRELVWTFGLPPIQPAEPTAATFPGLTDGKLCAVRYEPFNNYLDTWMMTSGLGSGGILIATYEALSGNLANLEPNQRLYRNAELQGMMSWNAELMLHVVKSIPAVALIGDGGELLVEQIKEGRIDIVSFAEGAEQLEGKGVVQIALYYFNQSRQQANSLARQAAHLFLKDGRQTKLIGTAAKWLGAVLNLPQWTTSALFVRDTFAAERDACFLMTNGSATPFDPLADYNWATGSWGACSGPCGLNQGTQTRAVYCEDESGNQVSDAYCGGNKPETTQACTVSDCDDGDLIAGRYLPIGEDRGIIRDTVNGLEWQRCAVGQTWNPEDETCSGSSSSHRWSEATTLTAPGGFRLPTISELRTLVYCSSGQPALFGMPSNTTTCGGGYDRPTIVSEAFPRTTRAWFWSSSPYANASYGAWSVSFYGGNVYGYHKGIDSYVRLVRAGQ